MTDMTIRFGDAYMLGAAGGEVLYIRSCSNEVPIDLVRAFSSRQVER